jgi:uncharacterized repeat protein (TIGR01451 family)
MADGDRFTARITVTVATSNTILVNTARASTDMGGGIVVSDTDTITHEAVASPELGIAKTSVPRGAEVVGLTEESIVEPGDQITYTITVTNSGAGPVLSKLDIIDLLPPVPEYVTVDLVDHSPALTVITPLDDQYIFRNWFTFTVPVADITLISDTFDSGLGSWAGDKAPFPPGWQAGTAVVGTGADAPWFDSSGNNYAAAGSTFAAVDVRLDRSIDASSCNTGTPTLTFEQHLRNRSGFPITGTVEYDTGGGYTAAATWSLNSSGDYTNGNLAEVVSLPALLAGQVFTASFHFEADSGGLAADDYWAIDDVEFTCANIDDQVLTQINTIPGNSVVTATIQVTVVATDFVTLVNTAEISTTETVIGSSVSTVTHYVVPRPELQISKSAVPTPWSEDPTQYLDPGDIVTYTVVVTNIGPGPAVNFQLTDTVPASTTYVAASADGTSSTGENVDSTDPAVDNVIRWELVNNRTFGGQNYLSVLPPGETVVATFRVQANAVPTDTWVPNTAFGVADGPTVIDGTDLSFLLPFQAITQSNTITHVIGVPVLEVTKTAVNNNELGLINEVFPGDIITYTVSVRNVGNGSALDTEFVDTLPAIPGEVAYISSNPPGSLNGNILSWDLGTLASGDAVTANVVVSVTAQISGTVLTNTIAATATGDVARTFIFTATPAITTHTVITVSVTENVLFMPIIVKNFRSAPDLIVESVSVVGGAPEVVIKNIGTATAAPLYSGYGSGSYSGFWVDLYAFTAADDPGINSIVEDHDWKFFDLQGRNVIGKVWFVNDPIAPGQSITLTVGGPYYSAVKSSAGTTVPANRVIYGQVDSINLDNGTNGGGAVEELSESNNSSAGPISTALEGVEVTGQDNVVDVPLPDNTPPRER